MNINLNTISAKAALAAAATMIAGAAFAAPATATGGVNVRTGPGTNYAKVDQLHTGEDVNVAECQGSWCYVEHSGPDGWVSKNYLAFGGNAPAGNNNPFEDCGIAIGPNGVAFGCGEGAPNNPPPAPPPPVVSKMCFYSLKNFQGNKFCVSPGHGDTKMLGFWNNRISSIKVYGNAKAKVCNGWNMTGQCKFITNSKHKLFGLNNKISSYWVQ